MELQEFNLCRSIFVQCLQVTQLYDIDTKTVSDRCTKFQVSNSILTDIFQCLNIVISGFLHNFVLLRWQVFMPPIEFKIVSWEGVKFRGRACQCREKRLNYCSKFVKSCSFPHYSISGYLTWRYLRGNLGGPDIVFGLWDCHHHLLSNFTSISWSNSEFSYSSKMKIFIFWPIISLEYYGSIRANYEGSKYGFGASRLLPSDLPSKFTTECCSNFSSSSKLEIFIFWPIRGQLG